MLRLSLRTLAVRAGVIAMIAVPLQGVAQKASGGNPGAKKGGILIYEAYEPETLNPISFKSAGEREVLQNWMFETLAEIDIVTGQSVPRLASKWEVSKDGKTFTFTVNDKAHWSDGKPVTADDVKFSFEVFAKPGADAPFRKIQASEFASIKVLGPKQVQFVAKERNFNNFEFLTSTLILPKHAYDYKTAKDLDSLPAVKKPVASGPYTFVSWTRGDRLTLKRDPKYWGASLPQNVGAYNFDGIVIRYIRDAQIAFENLKKGDLDYMPIRIGNTELWKQTKTDPRFTGGQLKALSIQNKIQSGYGYIGFNMRNEIFKDQRLRKALAKAINRDELIEKSLAGLARIPFGPLFSADNFDGKFQPVKYDLRGAAKDLADLGWKDTNGDYVLDKGGKPLSFTVLVPNARIEKELLFIQNFWEKLGVKAQIKLLEYSTYKDLVRDRKFEAIANGMTRTFLARLVDAYGMWHSSNVGAGLSNDMGYANPKVDALIEKAREELDPTARKAILDQVNDIVAEDYPMIQYSESKSSLHAVSSKVALPEYQGKNWYPYDIGMKYWYKR